MNDVFPTVDGRNPKQPPFGCIKTLWITYVLHQLVSWISEPSTVPHLGQLFCSTRGGPRCSNDRDVGAKPPKRLIGFGSWVEECLLFSRAFFFQVADVHNDFLKEMGSNGLLATESNRKETLNSLWFIAVFEMGIFQKWFKTCTPCSGEIPRCSIESRQCWRERNHRTHAFLKDSPEAKDIRISPTVQEKECGSIWGEYLL